MAKASGYNIELWCEHCGGLDTLQHRLCECPATEPLRSRLSEGLRRRAAEQRSDVVIRKGFGTMGRPMSGR